jgi:hypothetical protein
MYDPLMSATLCTVFMSTSVIFLTYQNPTALLVLPYAASAPVNPSSDDQPVQNTSTGSMAKMISRPFGTNQGSTVPQAKAKRSKKNITFANVSGIKGPRSLDS